MSLLDVLLPATPPEPRGARVVRFEQVAEESPPKPPRVFQTLAERRAKRRMYTKLWKVRNRERMRLYSAERRRRARDSR